jgi:hypothetical protein
LRIEVADEVVIWSTRLSFWQRRGTAIATPVRICYATAFDGGSSLKLCASAIDEPGMLVSSARPDCKWTVSRLGVRLCFNMLRK